MTVNDNGFVLHAVYTEPCYDFRPFSMSGYVGLMTLTRQGNEESVIMPSVRNKCGGALDRKAQHQHAYSTLLPFCSSSPLTSFHRFVDIMVQAATNGSVADNNAARITEHPRHAYARTILGKELFDKLASSKILVVGAGGIGCELLKNLVLVGFGHVEIIDLDTIDLSNLNRQFLFQKAHIGKPKSLVASSTASQFNPLVHVRPHHSNVKDTAQFGWEFFEQFDVVCNALDNLDARRWVNRMCIMTGIPLVESGTTGFLGQVQPIARVRVVLDVFVCALLIPCLPFHAAGSQ